MEQTSFQRIKNCERNLRSRSRSLCGLLLVLAGGSAVLGVSAFAALADYSLEMNAIYALFVLLYTLLGCGGVVLSATLFRELYDKAFADSAFSQPFTARERFLAKLLLTAKFHIMPMIAVGSVVSISAFIFCSTDSGRPQTVLLSVICSVEGAIFADACIFLFTQFCGSMLSCLLVPAATAVVISIMPLFLIYWFYWFSGLVATLPEYVTDVISKFGVLDLLNMGGITDSDIGKTVLWLHLAVVAAADLLLSAGMLVLGLKKYSLRNGLQTGKSITSNAFYNIFFALCIMLIFVAFIYQSLYQGVIWSLVAALVITFIRVQKHFDLHALCGMLVRVLCCCAAALCLSFVIYITYGFGVKDASPESMANKDSELTVQQWCYLPIQYDYENLASYWDVDCFRIEETGKVKEASAAIFEYMNEHSIEKKNHTADRFFSYVIYGTDTVDPEPDIGDYAITLTVENRPKSQNSNSYEYYSYHAYMTTEDFREMPDWLEEHGVPVIRKTPDAPPSYENEMND